MACSRIHFNLNLRFPSDAAPIASTCHSPSRLSLSLSHSPLFTTTPKIAYSSAPRRTCGAVCSQMTMEEKPLSENRMLVYVPPHPLIKHWVSVLRNEQTPCPIFRNAMAELGRLLMYEASRDWLPTVSGEIQSPMGVASVEFIDPREPVAVIPILRAGLALAEHASSILPATKTYHLAWLVEDRDEFHKECPVASFASRLPGKFPEGSKVFVVDPMLATASNERCGGCRWHCNVCLGLAKGIVHTQLVWVPGLRNRVRCGTIVAAVSLLKERGVGNKQIKVISAVSAPPALQKLSEQFPGFIIPGLGDAGDRSFGTDT
ncbi:hypothetical protein JHK87_006400 [Glycine soja]|nr:hypothetical protein JHK87_006400 [Glycine soja]